MERGLLATDLLLLMCTLFLVIAQTKSQEVEDESEFNYMPGSETGPARWGEIRHEWRMCLNGSMQSPIDLSNERVQVVSHLGRLKRSYKPTNATLKNRGHDMMLRWEEGAGSIHINRTEYVLRQCHWHSPSEHAVNGRRYDLEVHLVHESPEGKAAVIGIMYKIGRPDTFLASLTNHIEAIAESGDIIRAIGIVNPKEIKLGSRKYYRYIGSLTTPPCTQNVLWTIVHKVRTVAREQVKLLREAVHDDAELNARPLQPINRRTVQLYTPTESDLQGNET